VAFYRVTRHAAIMRVGPAILICLGVLGSARAAWDAAIATPYWRIESPAGTIRWIEIHDLDAGRTTGLYHVQVLERELQSPPWKFRSLASHMALTESALRASIIDIAEERSVYPETFESGYSTWKEREAAGDAPVCKSEVTRCL